MLFIKPMCALVFQFSEFTSLILGLTYLKHPSPWLPPFHSFTYGPNSINDWGKFNNDWKLYLPNQIGFSLFFFSFSMIIIFQWCLYLIWIAWFFFPLQLVFLYQYNFSLLLKLLTTCPPPISLLPHTPTIPSNSQSIDIFNTIFRNVSDDKLSSISAA